MKVKSIYVSTLLAALAAPSAVQMQAAPASSLSAAVENITASGTVVDQYGEPIIGASVIEVGKNTGVTTDIDGKFQIVVPKGAKIGISYVGCKPVQVVASTQMNIVLEDEATALQEMVVVGFGKQKKVNLTGSVGVATAKDIEARPVNNLSEALQGLVPGMAIGRNSGEIGSNPSINIRGIGTIGDGSSGAPLVLIDGMEGDLNSVNPQDVESISVLKDAAASSIYGSRAPFGVILVTTKKGSAGKVNVTYNNSFRWASPINMPEAMNSVDFMLYYNQGFKNNGQSAFFPENTILNAIEFQKNGGTNKGGLPTDGNVWGKPAGDPFTMAYANVDWFKEMYKDNAFSQEHNAAVSGGTETINYYASPGYLDYNGMLRPADDSMKRYNATGKFSAKLTKWATFNYSARFIRTDVDKPTMFNWDIYDLIGRQSWPNLPVYDENGYYHNSNADTPIMRMAEGGDYTSQRDLLYQQASVVLEPIKDWFVHAEFNYSTDNTDEKSTSLPRYNHKVDGTLDDTGESTSIYQANVRNNYMNWNIFTDYSWTLKDDHNFKVMAGFQSEEMRQKGFNVRAYGIQDVNLPEIDLTTGLLGNGKEQSAQVHGYRNQWSILGFFGRINYDYMGKYLIEANLRHDGSSRFRKGKRWTTAPSVSLGWRISEENFMKDARGWLNNLKLRLSYGTLANQNTNVWYPTYRTMTINTAYGSWLVNGNKPNTSWVNGLVSSALTWEKVRTWNAAVDFGLLNDRLSGSFDYYVRYTDDMVGPGVSLPSTLGQDPPKTNNCDLRTNGWELQLTWRDNTSFGLNYSITGSLSDAKTVIRRYPGNPTNQLGKYIAGREINEIWGFETMGIAQSQEQMDQHLATVGGQDKIGNNWAAGDIMYANLDDEEGISKGAQTLEDHGDMKLLGNSTPRLLFGIDITANYKGFDFRAFFQGVAKRDIFKNDASFWGLQGWEWGSQGYKEHLDFWHDTDITSPDGSWVIPANTDAYYPRVLHSDKNHEIQSKYMQNGAYLRCKNMQIGYTLPASLTRQFYVQNLRLFVSVDNLFTVTKLSKLYDPETVDGGQHGHSYPLARTWSFGLSLSL